MATASVQHRAPVTCIAPRTGTTCWCRRSSGSSRGHARAFCADTAFDSRRSTTLSNSATCMPSASRRTRAWSWRSRTSCFVHGDGPSRKPLVRCKCLCYQAESWATPRRIVAKVEQHPDELFAASALSWPTWLCRAARSSGPTTSGHSRARRAANEMGPEPRRRRFHIDGAAWELAARCDEEIVTCAGVGWVYNRRCSESQNGNPGVYLAH